MNNDFVNIPIGRDLSVFCIRYIHTDSKLRNIIKRNN